MEFKQNVFLYFCGILIRNVLFTDKLKTIIYKTQKGYDTQQSIGHYNIDSRGKTRRHQNICGRGCVAHIDHPRNSF